MSAAPYTVEQHIELKRVSSIAPAPDGTWLAVAVQRLDREGAKYVSDLWKVPTDGTAPMQLTRGDSKDAAPCFRHDGALGFLSNRQPTEVKPDEDAEKRMQVWILPAGGGEPQQLTDEPLGVESFRFAKSAAVLALFAPVLPGVEHDKQRETASERRKKHTSARHFRQQPVRHWDHWLHQNDNMADTHLIAYAADGTQRVDLTPEAKHELSIEPALDVASDGKQVAVTWQTPGQDREIDTAIRVIDIATKSARTLGAATNTNNDVPLLSPDGKTLAVVRSTRSSTTAMRPTLTLIDVATGTMREMGKAFDAWPHPGAWTEDGKQIVFTCDLDGQVPVFTLDVASDKVERITAARSSGAHSDIQVLKDGRIVGIRSTFREPPEAFAVTNQPGSPPQVLARLSGLRVSRLGRGRALHGDVDRRRIDPVLRDQAGQGAGQAADVAVDPRRPDRNAMRTPGTGAGIRCSRWRRGMSSCCRTRAARPDSARTSCRASGAMSGASSATKT